MATATFTSPGDRSRGTRKVKVGLRPTINVSFRGETEIPGQGPRRQKTPIQRAREELSKALEPYNISDILRREFISEALRLDTVTTMNMITLAAVMNYLHDFPEPTPEDFTDENLDRYLSRLMEDFITPSKVQGREQGQPTNREQVEVRYRYKQTMLRYILKVIALRTGIQLTTEPLTEVGQPLGENIIVSGGTIGGEEEEEF